MPRERLTQIARALPSWGTRRPAPTATLADLDSIARLEFVLAVEEEFAVEFADAELQRIGSLDEFARLLEIKQREPAPVPCASSGPEEPLPVLPSPTPWQGALSALVRLGYRLDVRGLDHLPRSGACLLCANHTSHLDSPVLLAATRPRRRDLVFSAARDYFFTPRWSARVARAVLPLVPLERAGDLGGLRRNLRQLEAGCRAGRVMVLFPEGTRSADGTLQPFKPGLAFFAERLAVPVVPCVLSGTHRAWPRHAGWPRPGRLTVTFGPALPPAAPGAGEALAAQVRAALLTLSA